MDPGVGGSGCDCRQNSSMFPLDLEWMNSSRDLFFSPILQQVDFSFFVFLFKSFVCSHSFIPCIVNKIVLALFTSKKLNAPVYCLEFCEMIEAFVFLSG